MYKDKKLFFYSLFLVLAIHFTGQNSFAKDLLTNDRFTVEVNDDWCDDDEAIVIVKDRRTGNKLTKIPSDLKVALTGVLRFECPTANSIRVSMPTGTHRVFHSNSEMSKTQTPSVNVSCDGWIPYKTQNDGLLYKRPNDDYFEFFYNSPHLWEKEELSNKTCRLDLRDSGKEAIICKRKETRGIIIARPTGRMVDRILDFYDPKDPMTKTKVEEIVTFNDGRKCEFRRYGIFCPRNIDKSTGELYCTNTSGQFEKVEEVSYSVPLQSWDDSECLQETVVKLQSGNSARKVNYTNNTCIKDGKRVIVDIAAEDLKLSPSERDEKKRLQQLEHSRKLSCASVQSACRSECAMRDYSNFGCGGLYASCLPYENQCKKSCLSLC